MTATLLPIPDDPYFQQLIDEWNSGYYLQHAVSPRSLWLSHFETALKQHYPASSSRDRSLTARHYAPFPLAAGHDVP